MCAAAGGLKWCSVRVCVAYCALCAACAWGDGGKLLLLMFVYTCKVAGAIMAGAAHSSAPANAAAATAAAAAPMETE